MNKTRKQKILVAMSGGVDSSVSAALLCEQGHRVTGAFMKNWSKTRDAWTGECQWKKERRDAMRVAAQLGIPFLTFDFEDEYRRRVWQTVVDEYAKGITPNPDVLCNEFIKFGIFFDAAKQRGFDGIATGHYARVRDGADGLVHLLRGKDRKKDQSYFLYRVHQEALSCTQFPIGDLKKNVVRKLASKLGIVTAKKPDSQGICFLDKFSIRDFLLNYFHPKPGKIMTAKGAIVGEHQGLSSYTIGQRHGIGSNRSSQMWYVAKKDLEKNQLIVVESKNHPLLLLSQAEINNLTFCAPVKTRNAHEIRVEIVIRYRQQPTKGILSINGDHGTIRFDTPAWAISHGQSAVFYQGQECLGGGTVI